MSARQWLDGNETYGDRTAELMLLFDASTVVEHAFNKSLSRENLSFAQLRVMTGLYLSEGRLTPGNLAGLMREKPHGVSGLLNRMEARELISRSTDRRDRRNVWIGLTATGRELLEQSLPILLAMASGFTPFFAGPAGEATLDILAQVRDKAREIRATLPIQP